MDTLIREFDVALRAIAGATRAERANPAERLAPEAEQMNPEERRHVSGLMRINHVGEVCAQALYQAQKLTARTPAVRAQMDAAAKRKRIIWPGARTACVNWARVRAC
jgi:ubiquinone biosynthesis monooxygenase Coq7